MIRTPIDGSDRGFGKKRSKDIAAQKIKGRKNVCDLPVDEAEKGSSNTKIRWKSLVEQHQSYSDSN